ncbi:restriction endonuclease subunit S [Staphylococcus aureus]|uniref:restriction endonuclease subunit S n=1 Tax=Staphylococcus aureus TaxID=1280 RepID=UPI0036D3AAA9
MEFRKLGEFCTVKGGKRLPKGTQLQESKTNHPYLRIKDFNNGNIDINNLMYISEEVFNKISNYTINKGNIFLSIVGTIGLVDVIEEELDKSSLTENAVKIYSNDEKQLSTEFLSYYLKSTMGQHEIRIRTVGSTQPKLAITRIKDINVPMIDIKKQYKITWILSNIDKKIKLNRTIIANLEELSQTLFKRWFVDFEFPNEEGNPYKSSGGEMIDSELGKIPSNWKIYKLKDIASHKKETFNPKKSEEVTVKHFSLPAYDNEEQAIEEEVNKIKSNKWIINNNCVLFSKMNPDTKRIWLPVIDNKKLNVASSEFVVMESPNNKINSFIYNICLNSQFVDYLKANTTGSTNSRQRVKPTIAVNYKLAIEDSIVKKYSEIITPYMEEMKILRSEIGKLTQLRDTLLPKLMSGELEISDDIEVNSDELSI